MWELAKGVSGSWRLSQLCERISLVQQTYQNLCKQFSNIFWSGPYASTVSEMLHGLYNHKLKCFKFIYWPLINDHIDTGAVWDNIFLFIAYSHTYSWKPLCCLLISKDPSYKTRVVTISVLSKINYSNIFISAQLCSMTTLKILYSFY